MSGRTRWGTTRARSGDEVRPWRWYPGWSSAGEQGLVQGLVQGLIPGISRLRHLFGANLSRFTNMDHKTGSLTLPKTTQG